MEHAALFLDQEGTDTRLHAEAGAEVVVAILAGETVRFERFGRARSLRDILPLFPRDTGFLVCEGLVEAMRSPLVVLCLRRMADLDETLAVRGISAGAVLAISGVVAAGAPEGSVRGPQHIPVLDAADAVQRRALADLIIRASGGHPNRKAYPDE